MANATNQDRLIHRVSDAFSTLPERYLGASPSFKARYQIRLGDIGRAWGVHVHGDRCSVNASPPPKPDVIIGTDARTWLELREGKLSGLDAFSQRRLYARGNLDLAVGFEGLFRLPDDRPPLLRIHKVQVKRNVRISTLTAGTGEQHVLLLHGLGSNKTSFFDTVAALDDDYTVHALDLPGFGSSSKPARASYDAAWFADMVIRFMDEMEIGRAHLIGNSMGGRVAIEVGLTEPERVRTLGLLAPAVAFRRRRELAPLVRLLRPELAAIPHAISEDIVRNQFWSLFADPDRIDPAVADIAAEEFCRGYRSGATRVAFYAAARNIYLDPPNGEHGFWARLAELQPPALFIWGDHDKLVPAKFSRRVAERLPHARQVILKNCGHVPQVELPARTNGLLRGQISGQGSVAARAMRRLRIA